jgi:hypothetical protein
MLLRPPRQLDRKEVTLDELLREPIVQKVMARDGVDASAIRELAREVRGRLREATRTFH